MFFHASPIANIKRLEPRISNHGVPLLYFSKKRENVLVYLSNAIEKYCKETGFSYDGTWQKWGAYGFERDGRLRMEEYYPNALEKTYRGVSGYIYSAETVEDSGFELRIPDAVTSNVPVDVTKVEYVPDAYEAILQAEEEGLITIIRYPEMPEKMRDWLRRTIRAEYESAADHPDYRYFLEGHFPLSYLTDLPDPIKEWTDGKPCRANHTGMSGAEIFVFEDQVLKIVPYSRDNEETIRVMRWLEGKLPVPKVLCYEETAGKQYLLMSKVPGKMACDRYFLEHSEELLKLLSEALKRCSAVDVSDCPRVRDLDAQLAEGRCRVENGLIDTEDAEPETFGEGGFKDPEELLHWLENNRPPFEPVFSHGDFCLPNVFFEDGKVSGFIDLGRAGISDKWQDIALCYRSLKHNTDGTYGGKVYPDFEPERLFDALGIEPDWEKIRYYILLDELF
ncbi:MAG: aminoglycoside 3'-phosphotransferase [Lachnospiraceae bacterium]|nr:aminoglycoside 3'-phosphotransferase [Lachnospiraceae bacterium]